MEIREVVVVVDPESGRLCKVFITETELAVLLQAGLNILLATGAMHLSQKETEIVGESDELPTGTQH